MKNWFTSLEEDKKKKVIMLSWVVTILSSFLALVVFFFSYIFVAGLVFSILFTKWNKRTESNKINSSFSPFGTEDPRANATPLDAVDSKSKNETAQKQTETHRVAGVSFREDAITDLMGENSYYSYSKKELIDVGYVDERVYKLDPYKGSAELVPEPENPHDSKAIKVLTAGVHIGYIKAGSCSHIHNLLRDDRIENVEVEIKGGDYKIVFEDYDDDSDKSTYSLDRDNAPISAVLTVTLK